MYSTLKSFLSNWHSECDIPTMRTMDFKMLLLNVVFWKLSPLITTDQTWITSHLAYDKWLTNVARFWVIRYKLIAWFFSVGVALFGWKINHNNLEILNCWIAWQNRPSPADNFPDRLFKCQYCKVLSGLIKYVYRMINYLDLDRYESFNSFSYKCVHQQCVGCSQEISVSSLFPKNKIFWLREKRTLLASDEVYFK